tara:strand:- start:327 stop:515 length:189 start_codon:yes stop_codon:yes gene_type:complete
MSKMKQLDLIADKVADEAMKEIYRIADWHMTEVNSSSEGDDFNELHSYIMIVAINKLIRKTL